MKKEELEPDYVGEGTGEQPDPDWEPTVCLRGLTAALPTVPILQMRKPG